MRVAKGSLTPSQVLAIYADERAQKAIARDYGICQATVSQIKRRATWAHITQ